MDLGLNHFSFIYKPAYSRKNALLRLLVYQIQMELDSVFMPFVCYANLVIVLVNFLCMTCVQLYKLRAIFWADF